jgi:hypothetical protein
LQGVKYDLGKPQVELIPPLALLEVAKVLTFGAQKYAPNNWKYIDDLQNRYTGAALRHILEHMHGAELDEESGVDVLAHAICCLMFKLEDKLEKSKKERARKPILGEYRESDIVACSREADHQEDGLRNPEYLLQYD